MLRYVMQKINVKLLAVNEDGSNSTSICVDALDMLLANQITRLLSIFQTRIWHTTI